MSERDALNDLERLCAGEQRLPGCPTTIDVFMSYFREVCRDNPNTPPSVFVESVTRAFVGWFTSVKPGAAA